MHRVVIVGSGFGGLFAAWFTLRANDYPDWPPSGEHIEPLRMLIGTVVLVTSSFTIHRSLRHTSAVYCTLALHRPALVLGVNLIRSDILMITHS